MRKDYILAGEGDAQAEEAALVERLWTREWDRDPFLTRTREDVAERPEFRTMLPYLKRLPPGAHVLDGGCGPGAWTVKMAAMGFRAVGIDLSRKTIERLQPLFPDVRFAVGDIRGTEFPDGAFDAYFSWGAFEHFEAGLGPCMKEASRLLKRDGFLFVSVPFHNGRLWHRDRKPLEVTDEGFDARSGYATAPRFYQWRLTRNELRRELERHGFRTLCVKPIHKATGIHRMLVADWGLPSSSRWDRWLPRWLAPFVPASAVAHMIVGAAQKR